MGQEELDLSTIWVALGMARDRYAQVAKVADNELATFHWKRVKEMQLVRDKIGERIRMLTELEEYDYGI